MGCSIDRRSAHGDKKVPEPLVNAPWSSTIIYDWLSSLA
jgi:hypothetical protein